VNVNVNTVKTILSTACRVWMHRLYISMF